MNLALAYEAPALLERTEPSGFDAVHLWWPDPDARWNHLYGD